jgi:energy-coupling factor transport system permease protein
MFHPLAWISWLAATLVALSTTRNPLHLFLVLLCVVIVNVAAVPEERPSYGVVSPIRFAMIVIPLSALFNGLTVHFGDTVLLRLPRDIPVLGGPITLESIAFGVLNGLVLSGILTVFTTVGQALPVHAFVRLIPRAFYPVAVVVSISVTFVPVTMRQFQQIREAQALRGHRVRGVRSWLPLLMPLLIGGLERALQLAEAMTARGFGRGVDGPRDGASRIALVLGLAALLGGWLMRLVWGWEAAGLGLMLAGAALLVVTLWIIGRQVPRTTYRPDPWTRRDSAVVLAAVITLLVFILPGVDRAALNYYPYPKLALPHFDPLIGSATLGLLGPALFSAAFLGREKTEETVGAD